MEIILFVAVLVMSVVVHEVAHGWMAYFLGDQTARHAGRLTLNPIPHIDPIGSILVPAVMAMINPSFLFGWAKPVPFNPYNLRSGNWGPALVALAGPFSNLSIALFFAVLVRLAETLALAPVMVQFILQIIVLNIVLALFNLFPIPPLDGSKVLFALLPYRWRIVEELMVRYQLVLILVVLFLGGNLLTILVNVVFGLLTGLSVTF